MIRRFAAVLAAVVVVTAGCGPAAAPSAPPGTATPAVSTSPSGFGVGAGATASSPGLGVAPPTQDPFGRRDTPPGGVAGFLDFGFGAGDLCGESEPGPPALRLEVAPIPVAVCAYGFQPGQPVDLVLRGPDGAESRSQVEADASGLAEWDLDDLPGRIDGDYLIRGTQGDVTVEATSGVVIDSIAGLFLPGEIRLGETGRVLVAGGVPGAALPAYLYFDDGTDTSPDVPGRGARYVADVGPLQLDANGEGRIELTPQPGDPTGTYVVVIDPAPAGEPSDEPDPPPLPSGTAADYVDFAESAGLVCSGPEDDLVDCQGDIARVGYSVSLYLDADGAVTGASVATERASRDALGFFATMARIATGSAAAEDWVRSTTASDQRRFGDVVIRVIDDPNEGGQIAIDPFAGSSTGEVWAMFLVEP
jgi:hypothetical protein